MRLCWLIGVRLGKRWARRTTCSVRRLTIDQYDGGITMRMLKNGPNDTNARGPEKHEIMGVSPVDRGHRGRKPRARKFYKMGPDFRASTAPGIRFEYKGENEGRTLRERHVLAPSTGQPAFPRYSEAPHFIFDKKLGRPPRDLEQYDGYWLISDQMKIVLHAIDPDGFAFMKCEVRCPDHAVGPAYWLCDVVRILDAVDEAASRVKIEYDPGDRLKRYSLLGGANLVFREDLIGTAHVFRMAYLKLAIICDEQLKDACKAAKLKGIKFKDVANY